jgi:hypothetical protein
MAQGTTDNRQHTVCTSGSAHNGEHAVNLKLSEEREEVLVRGPRGLRAQCTLWHLMSASLSLQQPRMPAASSCANTERHSSGHSADSSVRRHGRCFAAPCRGALSGRVQAPGRPLHPRRRVHDR